jgi:pre-rRNA-processing protein TSR1
MEVDSGAAADSASQQQKGNAGAAVICTSDGRQLIATGVYIDLDVRLSREQLSLARSRLANSGLLISVFGLLSFENKLSVLHFNVQRDPRVEEAVKSKSRLHIVCGFRRWVARPLFSQISLNCDKHKFERFLQPGTFCGASVYGPATFQPAPVLILREVNWNGTPRMELVASGSLLSVDPDRIVLKKVIMTGYPIRVRKRKAVVKHMFRCSGDVLWFKPAELTTKCGLVGHIREPVGTHGLMKVIFNQHVKQNDTVCLSLYKRVYPKMMDDKCTPL